jgi:hypothetical protein
MYLAEVSPTDALTGALAAWEHQPISELSSHEGECCLCARQWLACMDRSFSLRGHPSSGPRWLRDRFEWGPSAWPLHWCEAVNGDSLDCGALAAISRYLFDLRGIAALPAQLVQHFSSNDALHWHEKWTLQGGDTGWIRGHLVYHEVCAVRAASDNAIRLWDPTDRLWIDDRHTGGYATTVAVRIGVQDGGQSQLRWGDHGLQANAWERLHLRTG